MLSYLYLILCFTTGMLLVYLLRNVFFTKAFLHYFPKWLLYVPASFIIGVLTCGWLTYIISSFCLSAPRPLAWGNLIVIILQLCATFYLFYLKKDSFIKYFKNFHFKKFFQRNYLEFALVAVTTILISIIAIQSFHYIGSELKTGFSIFSDFGPHTAVMRSFSIGSNFPTQYPHFPDGTARYHFMFQFFCGNLEFLGMRLDWSMNLMSILSLVFFVLLFYCFVTIVTKKKPIALIASALFFFRSSLAFIYYFKDSTEGFFKTLVGSTEFIGSTAHEDWGLWNQNVYINQRHLPFALCVLVLVLIIMLPLFNQMMTALAKRKGHLMKSFINHQDSWVPANYIRPITIGVLVGAIGFWNGAVFISILLLLFTMALFSKHRLEFLIVAVISGLLFLLQLRTFAGADASVGDSIIRLGFLTDFSTMPEELTARINEIKSVGALLSSLAIMPAFIWYTFKLYLFPLLGIMPFITILGIVVSKKGARLLSLAFLTPLLFAFTFSLTPDIAVNHKYIMVAVMFLNIFAATFIYYLFTITKHVKFKNIAVNVLGKVLAVMLVLTLTLTGVVDYFTIINKNKNTVSMSEEDAVYLWVKENSDPRAIFLTDTSVLGPFLFAGRNIASGHGYYAMSAGYDAWSRDELITQTYLSATPDELRANITALGVDYIVVSDAVRNMMSERGFPDFSDAVIKETYPEVFAFEDLVIYQVA